MGNGLPRQPRRVDKGLLFGEADGSSALVGGICGGGLPRSDALPPPSLLWPSQLGTASRPPSWPSPPLNDVCRGKKQGARTLLPGRHTDGHKTAGCLLLIALREPGLGLGRITAPREGGRGGSLSPRAYDPERRRRRMVFGSKRSSGRRPWHSELGSGTRCL